MSYKDVASYKNSDGDTSGELSGVVPAAGPVEPLVPQEYLTNKLVYDPSYIYKYKSPTISEMIKTINGLAAAVTDLQSLVVNLVEENKETRKVLEKVWNYTKRCCDAESIDYSSFGEVWDGSGVLEEGIEAYINATKIK